MDSGRSKELRDMDRDVYVQAEVARQLADEISEVCEQIMGATQNALSRLEGTRDSFEGLADNLETEVASRLAELESENQRLRKALEWYADPTFPYVVTQYNEPRSAVHADGGRRAREALAAGEEES